MASLIRFSPTQDTRRMQREFDRVLNAFFPIASTDSNDVEAAVWTPRLDLVESEEAYLVQLDVPGVSKDEITINFHEGSVSVAGERRMAELAESEDCIHLERTFGRFYRMFTLPKAVDAQKISAQYTDGVLHLRIPKTEESKPRRIEIG